MKSPELTSAGNRANSRGFTLTELLVVLAMMVILSGILLAMPDYGKEKSHVLIDLSNLRQILVATSMYQTDNQDFMPHPTWGTVLGQDSGPDGWAYAVRNGGKITNAPAFIPSCQGLGTNSVQYSNQIQFFKIGQLGPYLRNVSVMYCPKDVSQWNTNPFKTWFLGRYVKLTSYSMNATVGGYVYGNGRPNPNLNNRTFKVSSMRPMDIVFWEQNETDGFYFNDAGNNPAIFGEGMITQRHYGTGLYDAGNANTWGGGGVIGRLSGAVEFMRMDTFKNFVNGKIPPPNDVLNSPGFRK